MGLLAPLTQRRNPLLWQADIPAQYLEGLDPTFRQRLETMQDAMPPELRQDLGAISGYRSVEHQQRLWDDALERYGSPEAARQWVAPPGRSNHNHGNAVDLSYQSDAAREWVHENAGEFGLHFPMSWENWHIEPIGDDGGRVTGGAVASAAGRPASAPLGGSNMGAGGAQQERAPFGQRLRDGFRDGSMWDALAIGLNGMTLRPDPGLQGMVGQRMQDRREDGRLNQTAAWLRSIGRDDLADAVLARGLSGDAAGAEALRPPADTRSTQRVQYDELIALGVPGPDALAAAYGVGGGQQLTDDIREYQFYLSQVPEGETPQSFNDWMLGLRGAGATNITVNGESEVGTIPPGWELITDPVTGARRMQIIEGGPEDTSQMEADADQTAAGTAQIVLEDINEVLDIVENSALPVTGMGGNILSRVPGTEAYDVAALTQTIRANIGFDRLQRMRAESPTGGALGNVTVQELARLESVMGNLEQAQSQEQFVRNLRRLEEQYIGIMERVSPELAAEMGYNQGGGQGGSGSALTAADISEMQGPELLQLDTTQFDLPQLQAYNRRMQELLNE